MESRLRQFVAEDLWLLVAILTFALVSLAGIVGLELLAGVIVVVGWFLLTPILLFWGEEIATALFDANESTAPRREADGEDDALAELKRRYATGEISEDEFEHRLDRLLQADDAFDREFGDRSTGGRARERSADGTDEREPAREME